MYDGSFKQPRRHMAYDASERDDDDRIVIGNKQQDAQSQPEPVGRYCFKKNQIVDIRLISSRGRRHLCRLFVMVGLF